MTSLPPTVPAPQAGVLRLLVLLAASLILALPALWNRSPLLYPDTPTYLRGAEAALAAGLPAGTPPGAVAGASSRVTLVARLKLPLRPSQSGLRVATTK